MKLGKRICETLKGIRRDIAVANEIDYQPTECKHEGDCAGTCPKCESETRWLEKQLRARQALGKAVTIASYCSKPDSSTILSDSNDSTTTNNRFTPMSKIDPLAKDGKGDNEEEQLMGEVAVDENGNVGDL